MRGRLVSPPFVDAHFHLDATLSLGLPRLNRSGTLLEGIALWGELKPQLTQEAVVERALALLRHGGGAGPARDPLACRRLRRPPARRRCAARRAAPRRAVSRPAARRVPAGRLLSLAERREEPAARARSRRRRRRRHSAFRAHDGRRRRIGAPRFASIAAERGLLVDMHCDEIRRSAVAPHRDAGGRDACGSACTAASPARI